jgi:AbrB family looped-hinge helix DNA binding protein
MINKHERKFYGITTLGEKGQVVVPSEARKAMGLKKGEKLLVLGIGHDMLAFSKVANIQHLITKLQSKLQNLKKMVKKAK